MAGTLRIHRGLASPERVLIIGSRVHGPLTQAVTEVEVEPGRHVVHAQLGDYDRPAIEVHVADRQTVDIDIEFEEDARAPHLVGGYMHLRRRHARRLASV